MIKNFAHKGLERFYTTGDRRGILPIHTKKIFFILYTLDTASAITELKALSGFHELQGDLKGKYSVKVSGAWRIHFEFINGDVYIVDYENYH